MGTFGLNLLWPCLALVTPVLALTYRKRKLLASSGAMFVCAGFALIPLFGQSAPAPERLSPNTLAVRLPHDWSSPHEIHPRGDPFARALPAVSERKIAGMPQQLKKRDVHVLAIVMGAAPHALLAIGSGATQIVGVGDAIEGRRVLSIAADRVVLADGQHLRFSEK